MKTLIQHASQIVTFKGQSAKHGKQMQEMHVIEDGCILIEDDVIVFVGRTSDRPVIDPDTKIIDATGKLVTPGWIDPHTHLVFGSDRVQEFYQRLQNQSYQSILKKGGGIHQSIEKTTNTSLSELFDQADRYIKKMICMGVTTVEAKSGYSRDFEGEIKQMEVIRQLNQKWDDMIVPTCMAAHVIPLEHQKDPSVYIDMITERLIPYVKRHHLAVFFDAFLEENAYAADQIKTILTNAKQAGFGIKLHCDEIHDLDGAALAASLGCISAEHLLMSNQKGLQAMADANVIATFLPLTAFSLKKPYAKARTMIDMGLSVTLATDFNPGSCFSYDILMLMALAVMQMDMTIEETLCAFTLNGAASLMLADKTGTLEPGKKADIVIHDCPSYVHLIYHMGINQVEQVIKNGKTVYHHKER